MACRNQQNHKNHVCQLKIQQNFKLVKELRKKAQYYCKDCEAQANDKEALCDPLEYKGVAGILKWR